MYVCSFFAFFPNVLKHSLWGSWNTALFFIHTHYS